MPESTISSDAGTTLYERQADGALVHAVQYTDPDTLVPGMFREPAAEGKSTPAPYCITKTGAHEMVNPNDWVISENDGEHFYTYPPEKFEKEYSLVHYDTTSTADLPQGTETITAAAATPPPINDVVTANTAFVQSKDGETLTPLGTTTGSEPKIVPAEATDPSTPPEPAELPAEPSASSPADGDKDAKIAVLQTWNDTASQALTAVDDYLHSVNPDLPEHYGMPVDGVRATVEYVQTPQRTNDAPSTKTTNGIDTPGTHIPSSPDAPSAAAAAAALSTIFEHLPKLHGAVVETAKIAASATHFSAETKSEILAAAAVVEKRYKML